MQHVEGHTMRLTPGQELKSALQQFLNSRGLRSAFLVTCVGSVKSATLRMATPADPTLGKEKVVRFEGENFEICSLVGTVSRDGAHLHTVLSRADGSTVGGHVVGDMVVQTTAEVVIGTILGETYSREDDPHTGYKELVVSVQGPGTF